jgi:mannose-1-phosphate guanylyltransferase
MRRVASALILAAGFGTRLRPLTLELPKPVVPVGDRPLLAHIAARCRRAGIERLVANAHHEHHKVSASIQAWALGIEVVVEPRIRGTAGGVAGARALLGAGPVLVWNGDILTDAPVTELLQVAARLDRQVLAVRHRPAGEGTVGIDHAGRVVRLRGKVFGPETLGGEYVGVMALGPSVVSGLPSEGCLVGDVALPELARGGEVLTVPSAAAFCDLGDLSEYVAANFAWLDAQRLGAEGWRAAGVAAPPGVTLERCLVGSGAELAGSGRLREVIAWPGARVVAPLSRAVVLTSGRVVPFDETPNN